MTFSVSGPPVDYGPLVQQLRHLAAQQRQPVNGTFELTERCNLSCRMCYVCQPQSSAVHLAQELSATAWLELAHQAVDNGMVFLLLTGGEVFLRPDFFEIYMPLTRMGLIVTLFTNGTLITDTIASRLADAPPNRTEITLYGATAETYEAITGIPGSYTRCVAGIETLVKHRIPLGLKTTITRHNINELDTMRQMAHNWGLPFSAGWLVTGRRDGEPSGAIGCRLTATECVDLESTDQASANAWNETALRDTDIDDNQNFYCQAGKAAFFVGSRGDMNPCVDMPFPASRPLQVGFRDAWTQVQSFVNRTPPPSPRCTACDIRMYCPRCPAWSHMENGTLTEPVPYLCEIARARKERYGKHS